jgi:hypothetical protein
MNAKKAIVVLWKRGKKKDRKVRYICIFKKGMMSSGAENRARPIPGTKAKNRPSASSLSNPYHDVSHVEPAREV